MKIKVTERATGMEFMAKAIEGGYQVYTLDGEKYKKLKESTFRRNFKITKEEEPQKKAPEPKKELNEESRENMIEKIRKILKLSKDNPSQEEGMAAALKAQQLLSQYNISEDEVSLEEISPEAISESVVELKHNAHLFAWYKNLAGIVAKNFRVKSYLDERKDVVFRGFVEDTKIATEVYKYLYALGDKLACNACKMAHEQTGTCRGVYNSFIIGYIEGIESALGEQCTALMLIVPKAVEEDYEAFSAQNLKPHKISVTGKKDLNYEEGLTEGKAAVKSRQVTEKKSKGGRK